MRSPAVEVKAKALFILLHVLVVVAAAVFSSPRAAAVAVIVAALAFVRYLCMASFSAAIGSFGMAGILAFSGWMASLAAIAVCLYVVGSHDKTALPWAAASALAGPMAATFLAFSRATVILASRSSKESAA